MKRNYLLPHVYQSIGVVLLFAAVGLFCAYFIICMVIAFKSPDTNINLFSHGAYIAISLMLCLGMLFTAFSCEKYEDEMIDSVRKSSVVMVAYVLFLAYLVITIIRCCVNTDYIDLTGNRVSVTEDVRDTLCNPVLFFLFYEIVFRIHLFRFRKALKNEE